MARLLTFLTDILLLLKTFQKSFESDTNIITQVETKKEQLFDRFKNCIDECLENGWEQLFLDEIKCESDGVYFFGHKLITEGRTRSNNSAYAFTSEKREAIIRSLIEHLQERLEFDEHTQMSLTPLHPLDTTTSIDSLRSCHKFIASDFSESRFITEYRAAADLLQGYQCNSPLDNIKTLVSLSPEPFTAIKTALARLAAAKSHSADVERFISK